MNNRFRNPFFYHVISSLFHLDSNRLRSENSQLRQQQEQPITPYLPFLSGLPNRTVINQMTVNYIITVPPQGGLQTHKLPGTATQPGTLGNKSLKMRGDYQHF